MGKRVWTAGAALVCGTLGWVVPGWDHVSADAGISITIGTLTTTEAGGTATFSVVLADVPLDTVSLSFSSSDTTEGTVDPTTVTFGPGDWDIPQTVTVRGVNDAIDDGDVSYLVVSGAAVSNDPAYNGINPADLTFTNLDDEDTPGFAVTPSTTLTVLESGTTATFALTLTSQPVGEVVVSHASSDTTEGTVSPATSTFTAADWNVPHVITVKGVNDTIDDGDVEFQVLQAVAAASDPAYVGLPVPSVPVTTLDDETPAVLIVPTSDPLTSEAGASATYRLQLSSPPSVNVTLQLASNDPSEGTPTVTEVRFTRTTWNVPQTITIAGVDDAVDDGDVTYRIQHTVVTTDLRFRNVVVDDVVLTNTDDDAAGVRFTPSSGLRAPEGTSIQFTAVLLSQPTAPVTVTHASTDTSQGRVSPASTTFDPSNWNVPQPVTITGVSDGVPDGEAIFFIEHLVVSDDPVYAALSIPRQRVRSADDGVGATTTTTTTIAPSTTAAPETIAPTTVGSTTTSAPEATTTTVEVGSGGPGAEPSSTLVTRANNHLPTAGTDVRRPLGAAIAAVVAGVIVQLVSRRRSRHV